MLELLPNRLLFSTTPPTFYVHSYLSDPSNPNSYTTVPATFLTDSNGDYIKDPNPAPVNSDGQPVQLYSSNGTVYPNPNGYLAVPAGPIAGYPNGFSIDAAIANAQTYQTDLASFTISGTTYTVGFNNLGQIARDFGDNGSQDLQREGGVFYPAFQSAANFNLGLQTGYDGIPKYAPISAAFADDLYDKNYNLPDSKAVNSGYEYGENYIGAMQNDGDENDSVILDGDSTDAFSTETFSTQSNGNLQIDEEFLGGTSEGVLFDPQSIIAEETQSYSGPNLSGTLEDQAIDYTGGASVSSSSVPTDGSQDVLANVSPGENINVQVAYSTTDENEDGEGESLTIATSGGDSVSDANYNATSSYNFTATAAGESVSATPNGWDGDESAVVTVTVSSLAGSSITISQEDALSTSSADLDTEATGVAAVANAVAVGSATYDAGAADAAWAESAIESEASADFSQLAIDPVDPDYKVTVLPAKATSTIFSEARDFKGIKSAGLLAASINALDLNQEESVNLAIATDATANKLEGAIAAGSRQWIKLQDAILKSYEGQLSALLKVQPTLAEEEAHQLNKAGLGAMAVTSSNVDTFEGTVNDVGLPTQLRRDLKALGVRSTMQNQIRRAIFAQNTNAAAGTYSSILTNASLFSELQRVAKLFKTR